MTNLATHLSALDAAECAPITYRVDPRLIADAQAALDAGEVPVSQRMAVYAAIRQAREFPQLAMQYDAAGVLLRAVGNAEYSGPARRRVPRMVNRLRCAVDLRHDG